MASFYSTSPFSNNYYGRVPVETSYTSESDGLFGRETVCVSDPFEEQCEITEHTPFGSHHVTTSSSPLRGRRIAHSPFGGPSYNPLFSETYPRYEQSFYSSAPLGSSRTFRRNRHSEGIGVILSLIFALAFCFILSGSGGGYHSYNRSFYRRSFYPTRNRFYW